MISNVTILLSSSSSKISKSGIFGPEFMHFCFFMKFWKQKIWRVLISNMTIDFLKFLPKNSQITHFWSQIQAFLLISNIVFFKFQPRNIQVRHFWSQIQAFSFFRGILQLGKFKSADFKYDNIVFKSQSKNTQIRHSQSQVQTFSLFHHILQLDKFEGADIKYDNIFFKFQPKNTQITHFWSRIQTFLFFCEICDQTKSTQSSNQIDQFKVQYICVLSQDISCIHIP